MLLRCETSQLSLVAAVLVASLHGVSEFSTYVCGVTDTAQAWSVQREKGKGDLLERMKSLQIIKILSFWQLI